MINDKGLKPHEIMLAMAISDDYYPDVIITPEGKSVEIFRKLTIKEKTRLLEQCAKFYAPSLKAIEAKVSSPSTMTTEELVARIKEIANEQ